MASACTARCPDKWCRSPFRPLLLVLFNANTINLTERLLSMQLELRVAGEAVRISEDEDGGEDPLYMVGQALGTSLWPCSRCCYRICIQNASSPAFLLPITQSVAHCSGRRPFIIARQNINRSCPCTYTWPNWIRTRLCHREQRKVTIYNCQANVEDMRMQRYTGIRGPDKW